MFYKYSTGKRLRLLKDAYIDVFNSICKESSTPQYNAISAAVISNSKGNLAISTSAFNIAHAPESSAIFFGDTTFPEAIRMYRELLFQGKHHGPMSIDARVHKLIMYISTLYLRHIDPTAGQHLPLQFLEKYKHLKCYVGVDPSKLDKNGVIYMIILRTQDPPPPDPALKTYVDPFEAGSKPSVNEDSGTFSSPSFVYADRGRDVNTVGPNPLGFKGSPFGPQVPVYLKLRRSPKGKQKRKKVLFHTRNKNI